MRKIIPIIILLLVLWASCSRTVHQPYPSYRLTADTLRQGGLELLHNIAVVDGDGRVLFTDSTEDYEPGRFSVVVPDSAQPAHCYLLLMVFDPCEERTLVLQPSGDSIRSFGIFPSDSLPFKI